MINIDIGDVDLVIQVESPGAVSRGLQRIGRAGHQVGQPSKGVLFPTHSRDFLEAAVLARHIDLRDIEPLAAMGAAELGVLQPHPQQPFTVTCRRLYRPA